MDRSASASIASSTANPPLYSLPVPSFLAPLKSKSLSSIYTTLAIFASLLVLEQAIYRYKKRHLPGAAWTIPLIGKFADSMAPSMEAYKRQWNSGALSAVSVFNMSVFYPMNARHPCPNVFSVSLSWPPPMSTRVKSSTLHSTQSHVLCTQQNKFWVPRVGEASLDGFDSRFVKCYTGSSLLEKTISNIAVVWMPSSLARPLGMSFSAPIRFPLINMPRVPTWESRKPSAANTSPDG